MRSEILLTGVQSSNTLGVVHQFHYGKGASLYPRLHEHDIGMIILKGQISFSFTTDRPVQIAKPASFIHIPRGTPFDGTYDEEETELLFFSVPAGVEQLIIQTATCSAQGPGAPPKEINETKKEQLEKVCELYGLRYLSSLPASKTAPAVNAIIPATPKAYVIDPANAPSFWVQPGIPELWTILASGPQTGGVYTLTDMSFTKGNAARPMKYASHDETYYVLAGQATLLLNERVEKVSKGDFVFIPRGTVFAVRSDSEDEMFRVLMIHTPSGIIEGSLGMLPCVEAEDRSKPPPDLGSKRPEIDPVVAMARLRGLGIDILAVADPLVE